MPQELKGVTSSRFKERMQVFGLAFRERFENAPEEHHPSIVVRHARTAIVYVVSAPATVLPSPDYTLCLLKPPSTPPFTISGSDVPSAGCSFRSTP